MHSAVAFKYIYNILQPFSLAKLEHFPISNPSQPAATNLFSVFKNLFILGEFHDGLVISMWHFHCWGLEINPLLGN